MKKIFLFTLAIAFSGLLSAQRNIISINTGWKFHQGDVSGADKTTYNDTEWQNISIPHTWNALDVLDDIKGYTREACWYRRSLSVNESWKGKTILIHFEGAATNVDLFINGEHIGNHLGSFTAFNFDISSILKYGQNNTIAVKVDNSPNKYTIPLSADFSIFGGIYRDVFIKVLEPVHFDDDKYASDGIFISTPQISKNESAVSIKGFVDNDGDETKKVILNADIMNMNGELLSSISQKITVNATSTALINLLGEIKNPILWSPENPYLYNCIATIKDAKTNTIYDEISLPIGVRSFSTNPEKGFIFNGEQYKLNGAARHQDYDKIGTALSNDIHYKDVKLLKDMGANFLRISHYPQDPVVYSTCDKLGIITWSEIPIVNELTLSDTFYNNCATMLKEMIWQAYNHPSVVMWGYMNEVLGAADWFWSDKPKEEIDIHLEKTGELSAMLNNVIKEEDPSRITVTAFHTDPTPELYEQANLMHVNDINGWDIYQGWYHNNLDSIGPKLDYYFSFHPERALFISEYGAGSDPRIHTYEPTIFDFSTEYQELFHEKYLEEGNKRDFIAGFAIWNFIDFQRDGRGDAVPAMNSKGIVGTDRIPKDVYYLYQAYWLTDPMVHIAAKDWLQRVEVTDGNSITRKIKVYSNQDEIELFHNNVSLGKKKTSKHYAEWDVSFTDGNNQLVAQTNGEKGIISDAKDIQFTIIPKNLKNTEKTIDEICINVGQSRTYFIDKLNDDVWMPGMKYTENSFGHVDGEYYTKWGMEAWVGIREGVDKNIKGTNIDPVYQTFLVGITQYKIDVPNGKYSVELLFAEPFEEKIRKDSLALTGADADGKRVFSVLVNEKTIAHNLNLAAEYGEQVAVSFSTEVRTVNGININLEAIKGTPVLNGIKITRLP